MAKAATGRSGLGVRLGLESGSGFEEKTSVSGCERSQYRVRRRHKRCITTMRDSSAFLFLPVRGVFPLNLPGVLNTSVTLLFLVSNKSERESLSSYKCDLLKISAICSFSHSISCCAGYISSSFSCSNSCVTFSFSALTHDAEPTVICILAAIVSSDHLRIRIGRRRCFSWDRRVAGVNCAARAADEEKGW
jgi:hypothetical protein